MKLLDLPPEIFQTILIESVRLRGLKRGIRLRLINKFFSQEVIWAVSRSGMLDNHCKGPYQGSPPGEYLLPRALENRDDVQYRYTLQILRQLADKLCSMNTISDQEMWKKYIVEMTSLVADAHPCFRTVLTIGKQCFPEETEPLAMDAHLLAAAAHLNMISVVKTLLTSGIWQDKPTAPLASSALLGNPTRLAAKAGNSEVLSLLVQGTFSPAFENLWECHGGPLAIASAAGHVDAVRILLNRKPQPDCTHEDYRRYLFRALETPSLEVYEMVRTAVEELDDPPFATKSFFQSMFHRCVREGWVAMAVYFLDLGATVDSCRKNHYIPWLTSPLATACRGGKVPWYVCCSIVAWTPLSR
ncbi:gb [Venturia nashicola]|uniref:Gb n=1 Tax=Venturia nashicola TaxID=86259 RepID=A0A4Z1P2V4_9PEZI|nr:gb [Venturia nashicola]